MAKLNPVDGLPEWEGRPVYPEWRRKRDAKRARRFIMAEWGELVPWMDSLQFTHPQRLLFVLLLLRNMRRAQVASGWVELERKDLAAVGLVNSHLCRSVAKLEALDIIEVQRRPGRRPLLRLIDNPEE